MSAAYTAINMVELVSNSLAEIVDSSAPDGGDFYAVYLFRGNYYLSRGDKDEVYPCQMNDEGEWVIAGPGLTGQVVAGLDAKILN